MSDEELKQFHENTCEDVNSLVLSNEEGSTPEQVFTEYALSLLSDSGETENCRLSYDEKISKRGIEHKISAYALYDNYETLDLFVTLYFGTSEVTVVKKDDAIKALKKLQKFLVNAIYKKYVDELEVSSQIFDLAHTLANVPEVKEFLTRVNLFLITDGQVNSDIQGFETVEGYSISNRVIDINYLFNIATHERIPIEIDFTENNYKVPCIVSENANPDYQSYLAIIPGHALVDIYEKYGARLLEQNVRSFLQFTGKYNKGIRRTIIEEPQMFLAFNNGLAATADEIRLTNLPDNSGTSISYVKDLQIVNGGQTTASIYHTWKKNKDIDISKIYVQLKLSIIKNKDKFGEIVGRIAEYANTQNKVSASDLSSNQENHVVLEKLSRSIWAPPATGSINQTRWFFERARGQYKNARAREGYTPLKRKVFDSKNPRSQVITKEVIAKYENAWEEVYKNKNLAIAAHTVVRGNQKNYAEFLCHNFKAKPDNIYFENLIAKAILFKSAEKIYGIKPNAIGDMRYITVPYAIGWLGYKTDYKIDLYKIWKKQEISKALNKLLKEVMIQVEKFIHTNAPGSLYGEWAKKEECWTAVKNQDLGIDLSVLKDDMASDRTARRKAKSDREIDQDIVNEEVALIKTISASKWASIEKISKDIEELTRFHVETSMKVMSNLNLNREFTEVQRKTALEIIDILVKAAPTFFDDLTFDKPKESSGDKKVVINEETLKRMLEWDTQTGVLKRHELQYVSDFVYGLKQLNDFHRMQLGRHYQKLAKAGFNN